MKKSYHAIGSMGCILVLSMVCGSLRAQTRTITGTVTAQQKPLQGASVFQQGTATVATTNASGQYQLSISGKDPVIVIRHQDYPERRLQAGEKAVVDAELSPKENQIEEVVLNAGYYKVKEKESTGSIDRVTAKDIENQPVNNVLSAIQGRMAGVSIVQNSGVPGSGFDIQIRGKNSLRYDGSYPLMIIDGVPVNSQSYAIESLSNGILSKGEASPLNALDINNIESMEILKDADATSIYGSRGSNGVILITTKKGKAGRVSFNINLNTAVNRASKFIELADTSSYIQMRKDAYKNDGISVYPNNAYDINGVWDQSKQTDFYRAFIGNTFLRQSAQFSVDGGSTDNKYHIGINHQEQGSAFAGNFSYKTKGFNLSFTHQSKDKRIKITPTIIYSQQDTHLFELDLTPQIFISPNSPDLFLSDSSLNWQNDTFTNPLAKLDNHYNANIRYLQAQVSFNYQLLKNTAFILNSGFTNTIQDELRTNPSTAYRPSLGRTSRNSVIYTGTADKKSWVLEPQIQWDKNFGRHHLNVLVGSTLEDRREDVLRLQGSDFTSNDLIYNLSNAKVQKVNEDNTTQYRYSAVFSRLNYNLSGRYILNLTARRDGSSRFGPDNRFANFGAIGAAWLFSNEKALKQLSWLSFGKLRASYGIAGNDLIGDYQYLNTYTISSVAYDNYTGVYPSRLYNPYFSWEKTNKIETALEMGFFKDRLSFVLSAYRNTSSNQLVGIPLPSTTGFSIIQSNFPATVQNYGTEIESQVGLFTKSDFRWLLSANISFPKNKLLAFDNIESSSYANTYKVGESMNIKKLYEYNGLNPATGLYEFVDRNNDGKIDIQDASKTVKFGTEFYGGVSNNLSYKNWSYSFLIQFVKQRQYSQDYYNSIPGIMKNIPSYMLDYWTPEHTSAEYQRPTTGANANAVKAYGIFQSSDKVIVDASYIRLNNIQLSYNLPADWLEMVSVVLSLQAQNLITITPYSGMSPEMPGLLLPTIKSYSFNVSIKF
ncbi:SusC/RagA family TonB-linked outer membrane protein [Chryseobacterium sp. NEB161]|nr:SusC/RagA family TonB-linked outer membrane protein [Chryseobacterium sp. NEB161]